MPTSPTPRQVSPDLHTSSCMNCSSNLFTLLLLTYLLHPQLRFKVLRQLHCLQYVSRQVRDQQYTHMYKQVFPALVHSHSTISPKQLFYSFSTPEQKYYGLNQFMRTCICVYCVSINSLLSSVRGCVTHLEKDF